MILQMLRNIPYPWNDRATKTALAPMIEKNKFAYFGFYACRVDLHIYTLTFDSDSKNYVEAKSYLDCVTSISKLKVLLAPNGN